MPMNKFLFDHQLAAIKVDRSGSVEEREASVNLLGERAERMAEWREVNGLPNLGWPHDERPPVSKGG